MRQCAFSPRAPLASTEVADALSQPSDRQGVAGMSGLTRLVDKRFILLGRPLPYSVYDGDRKLLLAQGRMVDSDRIRERLLKHGMYCARELDRIAVGEDEEPEGIVLDPLKLLSQDYPNWAQPKRYSVFISATESGEGYVCGVVGVSTANRCLILTAPSRPDKSLVAVTKGQIWHCKLFNATTVYKFRALVLKVGFEPFHYMHLEVPQNIEKRVIREMPRATTNLEATVTTTGTLHAIMVDLSVSGARVAVDAAATLKAGHEVELRATVNLLGRSHSLQLFAKVIAAYGKVEPRHPNVQFFGLQFAPLPEQTELVLHAYVQQQLVRQYDGLGQALTMENEKAAEPAT